MHTFSAVVTQFMGRSYYAEVLIDEVPEHRLVGVEQFRTAPVSAEELTDQVRSDLRDLVRRQAKKLHIRPADIVWS